MTIYTIKYINLYNSVTLVQFCSKHHNSALEAVCTSCNALVCLVCAITEHKGHNVKEIGNTMSTIQDRVSWVEVTG